MGHRQEVSVERSPSSPRGSPFRGRDTFYEGSWLCLIVFVCKKCDLGCSWRDPGLSGWDVGHGPCDQVSSVFPEVMITHCPAGRVESAPQPSPWHCPCPPLAMPVPADQLSSQDKLFTWSEIFSFVEASFRATAGSQWDARLLWDPLWMWSPPALSKQTL